MQIKNTLYISLLFLGLLLVQPPLYAKKIVELSEMNLKTCSELVCIDLNSGKAIQGDKDSSLFFDEAQLKIYDKLKEKNQLRGIYQASSGSYDPEIEVLILYLKKGTSKYEDLVLHLPTGRLDLY